MLSISIFPPPAPRASAPDLTNCPRRVSVSRVGPAARERLVFVTAFVLVVAAEVLLAAQVLSALNAAGLTGGTPIAGLTRFVHQLRDNLIWVAATGVGIGVIAIGLLFLMGHSRAQDYAIKALIGAAVVASGTGIVA